MSADVRKSDNPRKPKYLSPVMNELKIAEKLIEDADVMIAERDQNLKDANIYRNAIRHNGDSSGMRTSRMERLKKDAAQLQEQIDYNLAFAENILERASA